MQIIYLIAMGNCNQNFEDVGDESCIEHFEVSQRPLQSQVVREPSNEYDRSPSPFFDQEAIHNTLERKQEEYPAEPEEEPYPVQDFPQEPEVEASTKPKRVRPRLEELDLTFYHGLGLEDYVYQPIPE